MNTITPYEALLLCLEKAKTQDQLASKLGCSQQAVSKMLQSAKRMSHQYVLLAERLYGVSRHDLRPDIYPRTAAMVMALHDAAPAIPTGTRFYGAGRRKAKAS